MAKYFDKLSAEELNILKEAFVDITLLIASADNKITPQELEEATNTIRVRGYEANHLFHEFYDKVNNDFEEQLNQAIQNRDVSEDATDFYSRKIARVNGVFEKLPNSISKRLYRDYLSFAKRIANASGGILGFAKITPMERNLMALPMIFPVVDEEEE